MVLEDLLLESGRALHREELHPQAEIGRKEKDQGSKAGRINTSLILSPFLKAFCFSKGFYRHWVLTRPL